MDNKTEGRNDKKGDTLQIKLIDKQKQALLYSYETLGNLLSSAENFAGLPSEQYEKFNISTAKNHNEMKSEFAWELNCFQMALKKYKKKYGSYIFPENYSKEKIINDIKRYIERTPKDKDKVLYFAMIKIINGEKIDIDFDELFDELDNEPDSKLDPKKLTKIIGPLNSILEDIQINAENGNMAFNEDKSKHKETLKNIKESEPETIKVIVGKIGYLFKLNDSKNEYKFIYEENDKEKILKIEEEINYRKKKLYLGKYKKENIQIYLNKNETDYYLCSIFEKEVKEYKKSDISLKDPSNKFGYLNVPIIVYEDLK
jgi:hypothetical protein